MKKIIYMLSLLAFIFASCDPMEDTYDELDEAGVSDYVQSLTYTLTEDDYDAMGEEYGQPGKYDNFSSSIAPADYLPDWIETKFAVLDAGSDVNITYDYYLGGLDYIYDYEDLNYYQLTDSDYDSMGTEYGEPGKYNNFAYNVDPNEYLPDFLAGVYDDAESGFTVEVNYKYYSDYTTSIVSAYWAYNGTTWANAALDSYALVAADYDSMGEEYGEPGNYNNFAYNILPSDYLPGFLSTNYPDAATNELVYVTYEYYDNGTSTISEYWAFEGSTWSVYESGIDVPSGVTEYDLVDADYEEMGASEYFNDEDDADMISTFLGQKFPYASDDVTYCVTFKYVNYKDAIAKSAVQYTKTNGVWVKHATSVTKTDQYIYSSNGWVFDPSVLYTMVSEDYQTIVDYVYATYGDSYDTGYGNTDTYYGAGAYYVNFGISTGAWNGDVFDTWQDAVTEAISVWLPLKFPTASAQVDGVDINYVITFEAYDGSNSNYTITFQCTETGTGSSNPSTFEYVEGPIAE